MTPQQRITAECARRSRRALAAGCVKLLCGRYAEVDDDLILALGGEHGANVLHGADGGKGGYWPRVWAPAACCTPGTTPPRRRSSPPSLVRESLPARSS
jgi:hypothetical protein